MTLLSLRGFHSREVVRLALADIRHEWLMSLCMVLAVAAMSAPLLLFFGLKSGSVETMRQRLLDNPVNLELTPMTDRLLDEAWFERWRADPRVAFVVPHTRRLSAQADMVPEGEKNPARHVDIFPSLEGDVLLAHYGVSPPQQDQCVLTSEAANRLGVVPGTRLICEVSRRQNQERARHVFTVAAVLPPRAGQTTGAYIPLEQLEAIESYKDGRAVPSFGWPGAQPVAYPVLPSLLLALPDPLGPLQEARLLQGTGFTSLRTVTRDELARAGLPVSWYGYRLLSAGNPVEKSGLDAVRDQLRGRHARLTPESGSFRLVIDMEGQTRTLQAVASPLTEKGGENALTARRAPRVLRVAPWPGATREGREMTVRAETTGSEPRTVLFPARVIPDERVPAGEAHIPADLLGILNLLEWRPLRFEVGADNGEGTFLLGRRGYSGFRMYATALEEVTPLAEALEAAGIPIRTRADRIDEVRRLDESLSWLFWLIATASFLGGTACLAFSLIANVERKRRELAVLRLLGIHGGALRLFPLVSSLSLALAGLLVALLFFHIFAAGINTVLSSYLESDEHWCRLDWSRQAIALALGLGTAGLAALLAARRLDSIEPAESLRDE